MNILIRAFFAPAIISAYATYGLITSVRAGAQKSIMNRVRDCGAGTLVGVAYGGYYVATGQSLDRALLGE